MLSGIARSKSSEKSKVNASISGRIVALDALRGFAALYIFVYHLMLVPKPHLVLPDWLYSMVKYGWSGVTLFFILSGFTLYHSMSTSKRRQQHAYILYKKIVSDCSSLLCLACHNDSA